MKITKTLLFFAVPISLVALVLTGACTKNASKSANNTETAVSSTDTGYQIAIFNAGEKVASLGLTELQSLPEVTIDMGGGSLETGPTLQSVLELAGIKDYSSVTTVGMTKGRLATAELTLNKAEVTADVILDFNNQGKTKLCGKEIPDSNWVIDVTEIRAE